MSPPHAVQALTIVCEVQEAIGARQDVVRSARDQAIERLRERGGQRITRPPHPRPADPSAVDPAILSAAEAKAARKDKSLAGLAVLVGLVAAQLPQIGDELQDLTIELDGAHHLMSSVPDASPSDHKMIAELRDDVDSWRRNLVAAADQITIYRVTVGMPNR